MCTLRFCMTAHIIWFLSRPIPIHEPPPGQLVFTIRSESHKQGTPRPRPSYHYQHTGAVNDFTIILSSCLFFASCIGQTTPQPALPSIASDLSVECHRMLLAAGMAASFSPHIDYRWIFNPSLSLEDFPNDWATSPPPLLAGSLKIETRIQKTCLKWHSGLLNSSILFYAS